MKGLLLLLLIPLLAVAADKAALKRQKAKARPKTAAVVTPAPEKGIPVLQDTYAKVDSMPYNIQRQYLEYSKTDVDTFVTFYNKSDTIVFNCRTGKRRLLHAAVTSGRLTLAGGVRMGMPKDTVCARLPFRTVENGDTLSAADSLTASKAAFVFLEGRLVLLRYDFSD
ncbi:MAG: hypothetical protein V1913_14365 [Fibrobacterota bacterium]